MITTELESLKNAVSYLNLEKLTVKEYYHEDKRKTVKKYFLQFDGGSTISPTLDYEQMNHFILGMIKMKELC